MRLLMIFLAFPAFLFEYFTIWTFLGLLIYGSYYLYSPLCHTSPYDISCFSCFSPYHVHHKSRPYLFLTCSLYSSFTFGALEKICSCHRGVRMLCSKARRWLWCLTSRQLCLKLS